MLKFKIGCLLSALSLALCCGGLAEADQLETWTNSIGMKFVRVPAGKFMMGENPPLSEGKRDEHPAHEVTIGRPFYMGAHEVTQAQWEKVMGSNPSRHKGSDNPVDSVSWNDAQEFIRKLNRMENGASYRLPTEAEWEHAARAGTRTRYFLATMSPLFPTLHGSRKTPAGRRILWARKSLMRGEFATPLEMSGNGLACAGKRAESHKSRQLNGLRKPACLGATYTRTIEASPRILAMIHAWRVFSRQRAASPAILADVSRQLAEGISG